MSVIKLVLQDLFADADEWYLPPLLLLGIAFSSAISCLITGTDRTTFFFSLLFSLRVKQGSL